MELILVPQGESPNEQDGNPGPAVVICRGETHNLWVNHKTSETGGYPTITEAEAMVFGLSSNPGTPDDTYRQVIRQAMQNRFGEDMRNRQPPSSSRDDIGRDGPSRSVDDVLNERPGRTPDQEDFQRPWDVEQWNTPAGEDPKRTPIHELYERERERQ